MLEISCDGIYFVSGKSVVFIYRVGVERYLGVVIYRFKIDLFIRYFVLIYILYWYGVDIVGVWD